MSEKIVSSIGSGRHPGGSRDPWCSSLRDAKWVPAFAGTTVGLFARFFGRFGLQQRKLQPFDRRQIALQPLDLLAKLLHVLEAAIDRREADVCDLVEFLELAHDELADAHRRHLALAAAPHLLDDRAHGRVDLLARHRPLLQRALEAGAELVLVERLAAVVALDHGRQLDFRRLERVESLAAVRTLATAADRRAVVGDARVDHAGVVVLAERTMHSVSGRALAQPYTGNALHCAVTLPRTLSITAASPGLSSTSQIQPASSTHSFSP